MDTQPRRNHPQPHPLPLGRPTSHTHHTRRHRLHPPSSREINMGTQPPHPASRTTRTQPVTALPLHGSGPRRRNQHMGMSHLVEQPPEIFAARQLPPPPRRPRRQQPTTRHHHTRPSPREHATLDHLLDRAHQQRTIQPRTHGLLSVLRIRRPLLPPHRRPRTLEYARAQ